MRTGDYVVLLSPLSPDDSVRKPIPPGACYQIGFCEGGGIVLRGNNWDDWPRSLITPYLVSPEQLWDSGKFRMATEAEAREFVNGPNRKDGE